MHITGYSPVHQPQTAPGQRIHASAQNLGELRQDDVIEAKAAVEDLSAEQGFVAAKQLVGIHKSLTLEQAVFMLNNKIPINQQTIAQFNGFLKHQNNLGAELAELAEALNRPEVQSAARESPPLSELRDMAGALFKKVEAGRGGLLFEELNAPAIKHEISRFLSALEERSELLPDAVRTASARAAREIGQSLRFIEQINDFSAYAQLPVIINGNKSTAELYVFNDSSDKKKIDPQNATAFISIATANIGCAEVFVKLIGKDAECDFGIEAQPGAALFKAGMPALAALLESEGYRLSRTSVNVQKGKKNILDIAKIHQAMMSRYTLDKTI